jgi:hypothetical protein
MLPQKKFLQSNDVSRGTALDTISCMIRDEENIIYFLSTWPLSQGGKKKQQRNKDEAKLIT